MAELDISIIIVGKICSGKSTLAKNLSRALKFPIASFGGFLKEFSVLNDLPVGREFLQDLGTKFIETNHVQFLKDVIDFTPGKPNCIIFEGVRHRVIFDEIKASSKNTFSIYLDVTENLRRNRFVKREKDIDANFNAEADFDKRSGHVVEQEVGHLKTMCDFTISTNDRYLDFAKLLLPIT